MTLTSLRSLKPCGAGLAVLDEAFRGNRFRDVDVVGYDAVHACRHAVENRCGVAYRPCQYVHAQCVRALDIAVHRRQRRPAVLIPEPVF